MNTDNADMRSCWADRCDNAKALRRTAVLDTVGTPGTLGTFWHGLAHVSHLSETADANRLSFLCEFLLLCSERREPRDS
jgi:hypothetical protein